MDMATKHTRQPLTDPTRVAEIYRTTADGLHDWITRTDHPTEPDHDDPTVVLAAVTDDELIDYLIHLIELARWSTGETRARYEAFIDVVADEAKARLASADPGSEF